MKQLWKKCKMKAVAVIQYRKALKRLSAYRRQMRRDTTMRVVFLVQYIPAWNKHQTLYHELQSRSNVAAYIVCVPSDIHRDGNDTFAYFQQHGYQAIDARAGKEEWFDLRQLRPDFVFCTRPYNHFMPSAYASDQISQYSRICSIPYGPSIVNNLLPVVLNRDFYKDVSYYFAISASERNYWNKRFRLGYWAGLQRAVALGNPVFEEIAKNKHEKTDDKITMIWTPRWSTDPQIGGSQFFKYKDILIQYVQSNPNVRMIIRPHPLMFDNFVKTGEMSWEQVKMFQEQVAASENMSLDHAQEYSSTFWDTSFMISDLSSIIMEYFVTGKPLIYCKSDIPFCMTEESNKMLEGCYTVSNQDELIQVVDMLKSGEDPRKHRRDEIIRELFGNSYSASTNIADRLLYEWSAER